VGFGVILTSIIFGVGEGVIISGTFSIMGVGDGNDNTLIDNTVIENTISYEKEDNFLTEAIKIINTKQ